MPVVPLTPKRSTKRPRLLSTVTLYLPNGSVQVFPKCKWVQYTIASPQMIHFRDGNGKTHGATCQFHVEEE